VTLGVALAPDGNTAQQAENMKKAAIKWPDAVRTGSISKNFCTRYRPLTYPLISANQSWRQSFNIFFQ
jgi:hypothetical protein